MSYPAIVIANEIVKLANNEKVDLTPMKLQKILYLANGICYKRKGQKLIKENFEAWDYGPVIRSVYNVYKECGGNNIDNPIEDFVSLNDHTFIRSSSIPIDRADLTIIKEAWDNAKNLSAFTLSAWSHNKNSPWDITYNTHPKPNHISDETIKDYFDRFITN